MKAAKVKRAVLRFRFGDDSVVELDAAHVLRKNASQLEKLAALKRFQKTLNGEDADDGPDADHYEKLAHIDKEAADHLERLHRRAIAARGADALKKGVALTHEELRGQIRGVLARGEKTRDYVTDWAREHDISDDTVRYQIDWVKKHPES